MPKLAAMGGGGVDGEGSVVGSARGDGGVYPQAGRVGVARYAALDESEDPVCFICRIDGLTSFKRA